MSYGVLVRYRKNHCDCSRLTLFCMCSFRRRIRLFNARYYPGLSSKCEKNKYNLHLVWRKAHPIPSAGKSSPNAKRGKKCTLCQAREKAQPVSNVGKSSPSAERGKPSAGKSSLNTKRRKIFTHSQVRMKVYPALSA